MTPDKVIPIVPIRALWGVHEDTDTRAIDNFIVRLRRYIEEEIPHIASLMCDSLEALLSHAEVLVIGNDGEDARRGLAAARPDQTVIARKS